MTKRRLAKSGAFVRGMAAFFLSRMAALGLGLSPLLGPALLVGCASVPMPDLQVAMPKTWRNAPPEHVSRAQDLRGWWRVFNDPRLDSLVEQALADNLSVKQAQARLHAARTLHRSVNAQFLPDFHARTFDAIDPDASASFFVVGFDTTWELPLFGRRTAAERSARGAVEAAAAEENDARVSLVAEVVRDWIDLRAAQQREKLLEQINVARQQQQQLIAIRLKLRLASAQQLAHSRALAAQSGALLTGPRQDATAAAQSLAALLGRTEPDPDWLRSGPIPNIGDWRVDALPADLLRTRPDIARSAANVLQAAGELGLARAELYPSIGLGGAIHWSTSTAASRSTPSDEAIAGLGPVIDIPLFDWGMRKARANAKSDELRAAALGYRQTVFTAAAEVETALSAVEQQRIRETALDQARSALVVAAEAATTRQRLGLSSAIETSDGNAERDQAMIELTDAQTAHDLAYVALYKALGGALARSTEAALSEKIAPESR